MSETSMSRIMGGMPPFRQDGTAPLVIAVAGPAGSGKTTLGRALAVRLGLPILDLDRLTNPLLDRLEGLGTPHWLSLEGAEAAAVRSGRYASLRAAAADLVSVGQGAVLVAPFTAELTAGPPWAALVEAVLPAGVKVVYIDGPEDLLAARRRSRGEVRDAFRPEDIPRAAPLVEHVAVDAALSTTQQVSRVLSELGLAL